ncbi:putative cation efflux system protein [Magnetofaba australis IT-1]|uniref:Putative cation efflux system protein n=2 Tax=Magnetofaba TaxID=1472292 RepID=A0A1Y2K6T6_9PROT|nr:putative cation efflux system protein [Magnetofaba australis IT-1]
MTEILVEDGEPVRKGQVIARLDPFTAQQRLLQNREALRVAEQALKRAQSLVKREIASQERLDQAELNLVQQRTALREAQEHLSRHTLRAPAAGRILLVHAEHPGPVAVTTPIVAFKADDAPWRASIRLTAAQAAAVDPAAPVAIAFPTLPGAEPMTGRVTEIARASEESGFF